MTVSHSFAGENARNDVERDQPLGRLRLAIDREGDADAAEQKFRLAAALLQDVGRDLRRASRPVPDRPGGSSPSVPFISSNATDHRRLPVGRTSRSPMPLGTMSSCKPRANERDARGLPGSEYRHSAQLLGAMVVLRWAAGGNPDQVVAVNNCQLRIVMPAGK